MLSYELPEVKQLVIFTWFRSILRVRTLGRCKPVAQSLTEAAVPDAI
jgi:hypothetical protein